MHDFRKPIAAVPRDQIRFPTTSATNHRDDNAQEAIPTSSSDAGHPPSANRAGNALPDRENFPNHSLNRHGSLLLLCCKKPRPSTLSPEYIPCDLEQYMSQAIDRQNPGKWSQRLIPALGPLSLHPNTLQWTIIVYGLSCNKAWKKLVYFLGSELSVRPAIYSPPQAGQNFAVG